MIDLDKLKRRPPRDRLLYWIKERESIRRKRTLDLEPPWTTDPILQSYRFCNVRRMDDRVSRWLWTHWYRPYRDHPNMVLACTLARQLNNPEALEAVGFPERWEPERVQRLLEKRAEQGLKNYSAAYMITGRYGTRDRARETKPYQTVWRVCQPIADDPPVIDSSSMRATWETLLGRSGFSSFIAGQVVADLRWALRGYWADRRDWAPLGPGSQRGLDRLRGQPLRPYTPLRDQEEEFSEFLAWVRAAVDRNLCSRLEAIDYQNCLCEWDKYERALWGQGRPKRGYLPCKR